MNLMILWGQRKESYPGQYAPEPVLCWSEFEVEENEEGFNEACETYKKDHGSEFTAFKVIPVAVDGNKIADLLTGLPPAVEGTIKS